jgi:hypothetical protein
MKFTEKKTQERTPYPVLMKHKQRDVVMLAFDRNRGLVIKDSPNSDCKIGDFLVYQSFETESWERIHGTIEF